jgi:RNA polymerase sigma factor (sigma-70 family)
VVRERVPGDYEAFFTACLPRLLTLVRRLTASQADAEDIAVEALARAFADWEHLRTQGYRDAWVLRVAANIVIDRARRGSLRAPAAAVVVDPAEAATVRVTLLVALRRLPPRQREAVVLRYLVGLDSDEVAQAMGVEPATVRTHAHRGLLALRQGLGADLQQEGRALHAL